MPLAKPTPTIPAFRRKSQGNNSMWEASLVYKVNSRLNRVTKKDAVSKKTLFKERKRKGKERKSRRKKKREKEKNT